MRLNKRGLLFFIFCIVCMQSFAQKTAEAKFTEARRLAFDNKDYPAAITLAKSAHEQAPEYTDIAVFLGRLYTWSDKPDSARYYFNKAIAQKPEFEDAYVGYADMEYWGKQYDSALLVLQQGLLYHPSSVPLLIRKAKVLNEEREFNEAIIVVDTILKIEKGNTEARNLAARIRDNISKNRIGIKYDYVSFDKQFPDPWHLMSLDYTRQTKAGAFTARLNYANRFNTSGLQYEVEAYPIFSKTFYGYINLGYSQDVGVFPKWRSGASLYINLPKAFETEIGLRYLYFNTDVFVYTLYVGKYVNSFLFGARTFLTPNSTSIAQSYSALARYYFGGIDDYIGFNLGAGISPDDRRVNIQLNSIYKLRTYTGELTFRHSIRKLNVIVANVSLTNQEYLPATIGNQLQLGVGYIRRF